VFSSFSSSKKSFLKKEAELLLYPVTHSVHQGFSLEAAKQSMGLCFLFSTFQDQASLLTHRNLKAECFEQP